MYECISFRENHFPMTNFRHFLPCELNVIARRKGWQFYQQTDLEISDVLPRRDLSKNPLISWIRCETDFWHFGRKMVKITFGKRRGSLQPTQSLGSSLNWSNKCFNGHCAIGPICMWTQIIDSMQKKIIQKRILSELFEHSEVIVKW